MARAPATKWKPTPASWHGTRHGITRVIIHTEEGSQQGSYSVFSRGPYCAHFNVGADEVWQHADTDTLVWHCVNANTNGVGIEHAGYARYNKLSWLAKSNRKLLQMSANRCAWICYEHKLGMPKKGFNVFGHVDIPGNNHWDPGPGWPWTFYMMLCRRAYKNLVASSGKRWTGKADMT